MKIKEMNPVTYRVQAKKDFFAGFGHRLNHAIKKGEIYPVMREDDRGYIMLRLPNGGAFGWTELNSDWEVIGVVVTHPLIEVCMN